VPCCIFDLRAPLYQELPAAPTQAGLDGHFYSNLPDIALGWITVISFYESNPAAGKHDRVNDALVGEMVGRVLRRADVVGGGGGVYPQSPYADRIRFLLDLRGGAQRQPHFKFQPGCSGIYRDRSAARRRHRREGPIRFL
jgi:hypothetical protein